MTDRTFGEWVEDNGREIIVGESTAIVVAGVVLVVTLNKKGYIHVAPLTRKLGKSLGLDADPSIAKLIAKQEKTAQALIDSGCLWDPDWLKKHMRFEGDNLGDFPAQTLKRIQDSMQHPTAQKRLANAFANPSGKGVITYQIVNPENMGGAGGWGSAITSTQGVARETMYTEWFEKFTDPHETTHLGQIEVAPFGLNGREIAVYDDVKESHARIEQFCNGVIEGRNPDGFGPFQKDLKTILKEIDSSVSWEEFVTMKNTNPKKFDMYMKQIKERVFIDCMQNLPTMRLYTRQFLQKAFCTRGKGNMTVLKTMCEYYAKDMGIDFNAIWPTIEGYATGRTKMPNLDKCFDVNGMGNMRGREQCAAACYRLDQQLLHDMEAKYRLPRTPEQEKAIETLRHNLQLAREKHIMASPVLQEVLKTQGREWVEANYDALVDAVENKMNGIKSPLHFEELVPSQGEVLRKYVNERSKETLYFDGNGRARIVEFPKGHNMSRIEINYDASGNRQVTCHWANGRVTRGSSILIPAERQYRSRLIADVVDDACFKAATNLDVIETHPHTVANAATTPAPEVETRQQTRTVSENVGHRPPSAKREIAKAGGRLLAQVGMMYAAGWAGQQFQNWEKAKAAHGVGELMQVSDDTTLALHRADQVLQVGGLAVMGSGVALTVGQAMGKKVLQQGAGKIAAKSIPVVGTVLGVGYAVRRAFDGDWTGMGLELASAGMDVVSAVGVLTGPGEAAIMGASLTLDASIAARDGMMKNGACDFAMVDQTGQPVLGPNGEPVLGARISYKHDVEEGDATYYGYGPNGSYVAIVGHYHNGERDGEWAMPDPTDPETDMKKKRKLEIAHYENGRLVGEYKRTDENGSLIAIGNFTDGQYAQYWVDENGHSTGVPKYEGQYKDGRPTGEWLVRKEDGTVAMIVDYDKRSVTKMDEAGNEQVVNMDVLTWDMEPAMYPNRWNLTPESKASNSVVNSIPSAIMPGPSRPVLNPEVRDVLPDQNVSVMDTGSVRPHTVSFDEELGGESAIPEQSKENTAEENKAPEPKQQADRAHRSIDNGKGLDNAIASAEGRVRGHVAVRKRRELA